MQYPRPTTIRRRFHRPAVGGCTMGLAALVLVSAAVSAPLEEVRTSNEPAAPGKAVRLPAVVPESPEHADFAEAERPARLRLAQGSSVPGATPPPWGQPVRLPPVAPNAEQLQYGGLAREPDDVLGLPRERPIRLAHFMRNPESDPADAGDALPEEPIGQAPPDTSRVFLRQVTVLLQPGQIQFDWGAQYLLQKTTTPGLALVNGDLTVFEQELRDRRLLIPFAARLGVAPRVQAFARAPIGWTQAEVVNRFGETTDDTFNVADVNAGLNLLLRDGRGERADLVGTIGFTAPTGTHPFEDRAAVASLGDGFWSIDASLLWIRSYDPVVVFWGLGYRHLFERSYLGADIDPGDQITYNLGIGFAINDRITISSAFAGQYVAETKVNGNHLPGSDREPMSIRLALTAITAPNRIVEPSIRFGLTEEATNADFGIVITESF